MDAQKASIASLAEAIEIGFIDLKAAEFYKTGGGFTGLRYGGKDYKRIALRRTLPIGQPDKYLSVADEADKEIGIIRSLDELEGEQLSIVEGEIATRYFCPTVKEIKSVKDKLGYLYMELSVELGKSTYPRNCAVKDVDKNIRMLGDDRVIIFDVDGNRYLIDSLSAMDKKSSKRIEPYLF